ncbi:hypothetical protein HYZ82_02255 [Candidatus Nomurabacteria bacterium]|nr:hypothetical protein [Candidatus Nomurabacteria bacterium]
MVSVPEYAALVTINLLKHGGVADKEKTEAKKRESPLKEYQTGLSFRYPWEQVKIGNYINLRLLPLGMEESYPAMDGPEMHTKWQAPYRVKYPIKFIGVGREAVEDILRKAGSSVLSAFIAGKEAEEAKKEQEGMEGLLKDKFASMKLEEECGVEIPVVSLADLDYEPEVQKVRASQYVARKLKQIARELQAKGEGEGKPISDSDALTNAMIIHGKANLNVNEVKGKGGNALAALLMGMAQGSGGKNKEGGNKK